MIASELMTNNPRCVEATMKVKDALEILFEMDVRHLPVLNENELVGIVSDRDLKPYTAPSAELAMDYDKMNSKLETPLSQIMSGDVLTVTTDSDITEIIDLMIDNKVGAVPVIDSVTGKLVGIVSYVDVLKQARELL